MTATISQDSTPRGRKIKVFMIKVNIQKIILYAQQQSGHW